MRIRTSAASARMAAKHGPTPSVPTPPCCSTHPLPWTKMRQVYALLGLVKKWGPERVETACARRRRPRRSTSG